MHEHVLYPYLPADQALSIDEVHALDEQHFRNHGAHAGFVRPIVEGEFADEPLPLRLALASRRVSPFRIATLVMSKRRYPIQIRAVAGFDPARIGVVTGGQIRNVEGSEGSPGDLFYAPLGEYEDKP